MSRRPGASCLRRRNSSAMPSPLGRRHPFPGSEVGRAVVARHAEPPAGGNSLDPSQPVIHLIDEPAPAEFAVGQDIHARLDLVGDCDAGCVVEGFLDVLRAGPARAHGLSEEEEPARRRIGPHPHCRQIHSLSSFSSPGAHFRDMSRDVMFCHAGRRDPLRYVMGCHDLHARGAYAMACPGMGSGYSIPFPGLLIFGMGLPSPIHPRSVPPTAGCTGRRDPNSRVSCAGAGACRRRRGSRA